jgi:opacity protein-like surface antigen
MNAKTAVVALSLIAITGRLSAAQVATPARSGSAVGLAAMQTRPLGALGENIGTGYGIVGSFLLPLDRRGWLSLRAELGVAEYGHRSRRTAFSETVGGSVLVNVRTVNTMIPASVGMQVALPAGPVRPYVNGGVGAQVFYTESRVEPTSGGLALASTINQSDVALSWTWGGGLYVPLSVGSVHLLIDLGAQYSQGGTAKYLAPGSLVDLPGGGIAIAPLESSTHILTWRLGARMGL